MFAMTSQTSDELRVAGTILPRIELVEMRAVSRAALYPPVGQVPGCEATVIVWPEGDRARPHDRCWVGGLRSNKGGVGRCALPPLPAVAIEGQEPGRLGCLEELAAVLRQEGLARALRYDVEIHGQDGQLRRVLWTVRPMSPRRASCAARHRSGLLAAN
jgi:hypothetical protein